MSAHITETANAYRRSSGGEALMVGMDRYAICQRIGVLRRRGMRIGLETANSHLFGGMGSCMKGGCRPRRRSTEIYCWSPGPGVSSRIRRIEAHVGRLVRSRKTYIERNGILIRHYYHRLAFDYRSAAASKMT